VETFSYELSGRRTGRSGDDLSFGRTGTEPFAPSHVRRQALKAWKGMEPIGLHECRHSYASWLHAAGAMGASWWLGHADHSIQARYRHQLAKQRAEDTAKLDAYLAAAIKGKVVRITGTNPGTKQGANGFVEPKSPKLQNPVHRFDSGRRLKLVAEPETSS
jgi:hypothetical protein